MLCSFETQSLGEQSIAVQILLMQYLSYWVNVNQFVSAIFYLKNKFETIARACQCILPKLEDIRR